MERELEVLYLVTTKAGFCNKELIVSFPKGKRSEQRGSFYRFPQALRPLRSNLIHKETSIGLNGQPVA